MSSSQIIDLAIGLTFVFGITAALVSVITELIARITGLRGAYLLSGLRELVDGGGAVTDLTDVTHDYLTVRSWLRPVSPAAVSPAEPPPAEPPPGRRSPSATGALLGGPILGNQGIIGQFSNRRLTLAASMGPGRLPKMTANPRAGSLWRQRRSLPSYISARSFAEAVIDLVVPDAGGPTTMAEIQQGVNMLPDGMPAFKPSLQALVKQAGDDVGLFGTDLEHWYEDHMDRVSGWYKRHVSSITIVAAAILVILLNINVLTMGRTLYTQSGVSAAVNTAAARTADCPGQSQQACLADLQGQLSAVSGLPIGWGTVSDCREPQARCNWLDQHGIFSQHGDSGWQLIMVIIGFLITIVALVPGARFWFDLLGGLGSLRATGPKPAPRAN
jgi:hypothetical protein